MKPLALFAGFLIILFSLIGVYIVGGGMIGKNKAWVTEKPTSQVIEKSAPTVAVPTAGPGKIILKANPVQPVHVGESVVIGAFLDPADRKVIGSDLILSFDPALLQATEINTGEQFQNYPLQKIDNKSGKIRVSAFGVDHKNSFDTNESYLTVTFKTLKSAEAVISAEYTVGSTNKSTIVEDKTSANLLGAVVNTTVSIKP